MDGQRFDALAKSLATTSRRHLLKRVAIATGGLFGLTESVSAASCRDTGSVCREDANCCSRLCANGKNGRKTCQCRTAADCPTTGPCQQSTCNAGVCTTTITTGAACDDGNRCTKDDICQSNGRCTGTPVVCDPPQTCQQPGTCNHGTGVCDYPFQPSSVQCRPASCTAGVATMATNCSGNAASCPDSETRQCSPYVCDSAGLTCLTGCGAISDCADGYHCDNGQCLIDEGLGEGCDEDSDCTSSFCVNSVCCNSRCTPPANAIAICPEGICGFSCNGQLEACGAVCCADGEDCVGNVCQSTCLATNEVCDLSNDLCCGDEGAFCDSSANCIEGGEDGRCCRPRDAACDTSCDCCGPNSCNDGTCCPGAGSQCRTSRDCCDNGSCVDNLCCTGSDGSCRTSDDCCGENECIEGTCQLACLVLGERCDVAGLCCGDLDCDTVYDGQPNDFPKCCRVMNDDCSTLSDCCQPSYVADGQTVTMRVTCTQDICCVQPGAYCRAGSDCCQTDDQFIAQCAATRREYCSDTTCCRPIGAPCVGPSVDLPGDCACCSGWCNGEGFCVDGPPCITTGQACTTDRSCCSGRCSGEVCQPYPI